MFAQGFLKGHVAGKSSQQEKNFVKIIQKVRKDLENLKRQMS